MDTPVIQVGVGFALDEASLRSQANRGGQAFAKAFSQPLGQITGKSSEFQKSMEASNARVLAFGASAGSIYALKSAFDKLVSSTIEVEKSIMNINAIFDLGKSRLQSFTSQLFTVANQTGQTFTDTAKAAAEFSRQGLSVEETLKRTSAAAILSKISGIELGESITSLTSILNGFTKEALDSIEVINRLTAVDTNFAVSAGDLAEALKRVGASANDANVSFNQTVALITAARQITGREGSVIGNSLKTIFTRLQRPQVLDDLETAGVRVRDLHGKILPTVQVMKNMASAYENLASSQKSFVAETVGGVYQINILKAYMRDLTSGLSLYDGALKAADNSTGSTAKRMEALNSTISSQLLRTMNDLTEAAANVGNAMLGGAMKNGISYFDNRLKQLNSYTDPSQKQEGSLDKIKANGTQGLLKGVGNFLGGPGVQIGATIIFKLLDKLIKFSVESGNDILGLDKGLKNKEALEKSVLALMQGQKETMADLISGQITWNSYIEKMKIDEQQRGAADNFFKVVAPEVGKAIRPDVYAGTGYIPNMGPMQTEAALARQGGYEAGKIVSTNLSNGNKYVHAIVNSNETKSTVSSHGTTFDFINPPKYSIAGKLHEKESLARTGINPYAMPQIPLAGKGFIPNLAFDFVNGNHIVDAAKIFFNPTQVAKFSDKYAGQSVPIEKLESSIRGFTLGKRGFEDIDRSKILRMVGHITGRDRAGEDALKIASENTSLHNSDIQAVLNRFGPDFAMIAAYIGGGNMGLPAGGLAKTSLRVSGQDKPFSVPLTVLGHKYGNQLFQETIARLTGLGTAGGITGGVNMNANNFGAGFGQIFDDYGKQFFSQRGVRTGAKNDFLDVSGFHPDILNYVTPQKAFAAADFKASSTEVEGMASKIFRTLAGDPSTGKLKGPTGYVPPLINVGSMKSSGRVGILDSDNFKNSNASTNDFNSLIYSAIASGKPMQVNYGPMGTGKTTTALQGGGQFITSPAHFSSVDQFVLNKVDKKNLDTGVFGLALSASAKISGFMKDRADILKNITSRNRGHEANVAEHLVTPEDIHTYHANFDYLKQKFGGKFSVNAATGMIPSGIGVGEQRFQQMMAFLEHSGVSKHITPLSNSDYGDAINYFGSGSASDLNRDIKDGYFGGAFPFGRKKTSGIHELLRRKGFQFEGGGFVPNLAMSMKEIMAHFGRGFDGKRIILPPVSAALARENKATHGHATLSSSPVLVSPQNPWGLAAIDSRSQASASIAVKQHQMLAGQSIEQIKKASIGDGFVPNLALGDDNSGNFGTSIMLALGGLSNSLATSNTNMDKWVKKFPFLFSAQQRDIAAKNTEIKAYDDLYKSLILGTEGIKIFRGQIFTTAQQLKSDKGVEDYVTKIRSDVQQFNDTSSTQRQRLQSLGFKSSIASSFGLGMASQVAGNFSPTAAEGIDNLENAATSAGQALYAFPNMIGKGLVAGFVASGLVNALDTWSKGIADAAKKFELEKNRIQDVVTNLDSLGVTINNLNSMYLDAGTTTETLVRENKKYSETLAKLGQLEGGRAVALKLQTAPDANSKLGIIQDFKSKQEIKLNTDAALQTAREFFAKRTSFGIHSGDYSYSNDYEKDNAQQQLVSDGTNAIVNMSDAFKDELFNNIKSLTDFRNAIDTSGADGADTVRNYLSVIKSSGGDGAQDKLVQEIRSLLASEKINKSPEMSRAVLEARKVSESTQLSLDSVIKREQFNRRLFINQGAAIAGHDLDIRQFQGREGYNASLLQVARLQQGAELFGQQHGERTTAQYNYGTDVQRLLAENKNQITNLTLDANRSIIDAIKQTADEYLPQSDLTQSSSGEKGVSIRESKEAIVEAINQGLTSTLKSANGNLLGTFSDKNGKFDFQKFAQAVATNGTADKINQGRIRNIIGSQESIETLNLIKGFNSKSVEIQQATKQELAARLVELNATLAKIDFKTQISYLGGIRNLLDRNSRRELERGYVRGVSLLKNGQTSESRAMGAEMILDYFKKTNTPISRDNPLMNQALNVLAQGWDDIKKRDSANIINTVRNVTGGDAGIVAGTSSVFNQSDAQRRRGSIWAVNNEYLPESNPNQAGYGYAGNAFTGVPKSLEDFNTGIINSINVLKSFPKTLEDVQKRLNDSIAAVGVAREQRDKITDDLKNQLGLLSQLLAKRLGDAATEPQATKGTNWANFLSTGLDVIAGIAGTVGGLYLKRRGINAGTTIAENAVKQIISPESASVMRQAVKEGVEDAGKGIPITASSAGRIATLEARAARAANAFNKGMSADVTNTGNYDARTGGLGTGGSKVEQSIRVQEKISQAITKAQGGGSAISAAEKLSVDRTGFIPEAGSAEYKSLLQSLYLGKGSNIPGLNSITGLQNLKGSSKGNIANVIEGLRDQVNSRQYGPFSPSSANRLGRLTGASSSLDYQSNIPENMRPGSTGKQFGPNLPDEGYIPENLTGLSRTSNPYANPYSSRIPLSQRLTNFNEGLGALGSRLPFVNSTSIKGRIGGFGVGLAGGVAASYGANYLIDKARPYIGDTSGDVLSHGTGTILNGLRYGSKGLRFSGVGAVLGEAINYGIQGYQANQKINNLDKISGSLTAYNDGNIYSSGLKTQAASGTKAALDNQIASLRNKINALLGEKTSDEADNSNGYGGKAAKFFHISRDQFSPEKAEQLNKLQLLLGRTQKAESSNNEDKMLDVLEQIRSQLSGETASNNSTGGNQITFGNTLPVQLNVSFSNLDSISNDLQAAIASNVQKALAGYDTRIGRLENPNAPAKVS